jgi:hypothetical protein
MRCFKRVGLLAPCMLAAAGPVAGQSAASEGLCRFHPAVAGAFHLHPGQTGRMSVLPLMGTDLPDEALQDYGWNLSEPGLGTPSPPGGTLEWEPAETHPGPDGLQEYVSGLAFSFTAGPASGHEMLTLGIEATRPAALPLSCRGAEILVPVTVGGEWGLHTSIASEGAMTVQAAVVGAFSLAADGQVDGEGTVRTVVRGACVRGVQEAPVQISGQLVGDMLQVTVAGESGHEVEPSVHMADSMDCAVMTLRELPRVISTLAQWASDGLTSADCPLEIPASDWQGVHACGPLEYQVSRNRD